MSDNEKNDIDDADYWEDEEESVRKPLFNDIFGVRGDYLQGMFYEVRRKYLRNHDDNALAPPNDMLVHLSCHRGNHHENIPAESKTLYQQAIEDNIKSQGKFHLQFNNKLREDREMTTMTKARVRRQEATRRARQPKKNINIEQYSSRNPDDWQEDLQAGCRIWVNPTTGEVSASCPWQNHDDDMMIKTSSSSAAAPCVIGDTSEYTIHHDIDEKQLGTGSLVYDNTDIRDLFAYLDKTDTNRHHHHHK